VATSPSAPPLRRPAPVRKRRANFHPWPGSDGIAARKGRTPHRPTGPIRPGRGGPRGKRKCRGPVGGHRADRDGARWQPGRPATAGLFASGAAAVRWAEARPPRPTAGAADGTGSPGAGTAVRECPSAGPGTGRARSSSSVRRQRDWVSARVTVHSERAGGQERDRERHAEQCTGSPRRLPNPPGFHLPLVAATQQV